MLKWQVRRLLAMCRRTPQPGIQMATEADALALGFQVQQVPRVRGKAVRRSTVWRCHRLNIQKTSAAAAVEFAQIEGALHIGAIVLLVVKKVGYGSVGEHPPPRSPFRQ
jgi:hypothetical protein